MDWQKQMEDAMSGWTETQRRLWDQWFEGMRSAGLGGPAADAQKQQIEAWQKAVEEALERQQQWIRSLSGGGGNTDPGDWGAQMQQMMRAWTETQSELWRSWLARMEEMQPAVRDMPWYRNARDVLDAWEQAGEQAGKAAGTSKSGRSSGKSGGGGSSS
ncbi:hypothetical protein KBTX_00293 [wastewater metagenome]|uniref:Poly(3-hydroxyalkanoate) polymerase subunit PhaE n=2 Tax=unclassified sequences TaxID=12908 RepID=A0A5B8R9I4_9ZZZZ|nr:MULTISPECIES: hypothetical protein [Arhodomonas]MCS4505091.1 hypothetical protein [Arhodomonas aquaeolei]QEA03992.1 hypothetical protein KBTEX_00293 [uncultured organism]